MYLESNHSRKQRKNKIQNQTGTVLMPTADLSKSDWNPFDWAERSTHGLERLSNRTR